MKILAVFLLLICSFANAVGIEESLAQLKISSSRGRVFLSGAYHANGQFKCDYDFLQGGRIFFTLGAVNYTYTLSEVLGSDDVLKKNVNEVDVRGRTIASKRSKEWVVSRTKDKNLRKLIFIPMANNSPIKKIEMVIDAVSSLKSIYIDFGSHNLSFFAS